MTKQDALANISERFMTVKKKQYPTKEAFLTDRVGRLETEIKKQYLAVDNRSHITPLRLKLLKGKYLDTKGYDVFFDADSKKPSTGDNVDEKLVDSVKPFMEEVIADKERRRQEKLERDARKPHHPIPDEQQQLRYFDQYGMAIPKEEAIENRKKQVRADALKKLPSDEEIQRNTHYSSKEDMLKDREALLNVVITNAYVAQSGEVPDNKEVENLTTQYLQEKGYDDFFDSNSGKPSSPANLKEKLSKNVKPFIANKVKPAMEEDVHDLGKPTATGTVETKATDHSQKSEAKKPPLYEDIGNFHKHSNKPGRN